MDEHVSTLEMDGREAVARAPATMARIEAASDAEEPLAWSEALEALQIMAIAGRQLTDAAEQLAASMGLTQYAIKRLGPAEEEGA